MLELDRRDAVWVLRMDDGDNRFNDASLDALLGALDEIERSTEPGALVTVGSGKFYSNGLDLEFLAQLQPAQIQRFIGRTHELLARVLYFPMISVAALNGHAFAAGAMFALAHDFRVMRADRGYVCLPEVDIQIPFSPPMAALIQARLPRRTAHEMMVTGKRYGAEAAVAAQIIDLAAAEAEVLPRAIELARAHAGKPRRTLTAIKRGAYPAMHEAVRAFEALAPGAYPLAGD